MLVISRRSNETLLVGKEIEIKVLGAKNDSVKLGIVAPQEVAVMRGELVERVKEQNLTALSLDPRSLNHIKPKEQTRKTRKKSLLPNADCQRLANWLVHDTRNYLTAIQGEIQLMSLDPPDDDTKEGLALAQEQLHRLLNWLSQVSLMAQAASPGNQKESAWERLQAIKDAWAGSVNIEIECDKTLTLPRYFPTLDQALTPLLLNAEEAEATSLRLCAKMVDSEFVLTIADDGLGMDRASFERVDQTFFSTKPDHLGTGLSVLKSWISGLQGQAQIESSLGQGTTITLSFDISHQVARPKLEQVILRDTFQSPEHRRLESLGYQVLLAESDDELQLLKRRFPDCKIEPKLS